MTKKLEEVEELKQMGWVDIIRRDKRPEDECMQLILVTLHILVTARLKT